jgi:hypothetical protein
MNDLLMRAKPAPGDSQLASISNLYFFLLDRENGPWVFIKPIRKRISVLDDHKATVRKSGMLRLVSLQLTDGPWLLTYSTRTGGLHLDSVTRDPSEK